MSGRARGSRGGGGARAARAEESAAEQGANRVGGAGGEISVARGKKRMSWNIRAGARTMGAGRGPSLISEKSSSLRLLLHAWLPCPTSWWYLTLLKEIKGSHALL